MPSVSAEPLRLEFAVACPVEHAFAVWTLQFGVWWPRDHTVTNDPGAAVVLEGRVGGRIYERAPDGTEHDWGEVTAWEPPGALSYLWHLGQQSGAATRVAVRFRAEGSDATRIEIEHTGWERLAEQAEAMRRRNRAGWNGVIPRYVAALEIPYVAGRKEG
jgi:uncharacterized protein YndB with AHSA1/START domain